MNQFVIQETTLLVRKDKTTWENISYFRFYSGFALHMTSKPEEANVYKDRAGAMADRHRYFRKKDKVKIVPLHKLVSKQ